MSENTTMRIHINVKGRVQNVGFRAFVQQSAAYLGVTGWVRNVGWNEVETVAEGTQEQLAQFAAVVKTGPRAARVDESSVEWETPTGEFRSFEARSSR